ncbi:hypothetical protein [Roseiarcus sp.]|uniref:hypothetical protein n=1 Tax=Roseiarcus sp. TaxID=1969460 RepID=UPI003F944750
MRKVLVTGTAVAARQEAPQTGYWMAAFFLAASLLTYAEIRSEASRLNDVSLRFSHANAARHEKVGPKYPRIVAFAVPGNSAYAARAGEHGDD